MYCLGWDGRAFLTEAIIIHGKNAKRGSAGAPNWPRTEDVKRVFRRFITERRKRVARGV